MATLSPPPHRKAPLVALALAVAVLAVSGCTSGNTTNRQLTDAQSAEQAQQPGGDAASPAALAPGSNNPMRGPGAGLADEGRTPGTDASTPQPRVAGFSYSVQVLQDRQFSPPELTIPMGSIVRWVNSDDEVHTVTSREDGGNAGGPGASAVGGTTLNQGQGANNPGSTGGSGTNAGGGSNMGGAANPGGATGPAGSNQSGGPSAPRAAQPFDSGELQPGGAFQHQFQLPGRYEYVCRIHPDMRATVIVTPS